MNITVLFSLLRSLYNGIPPSCAAGTSPRNKTSCPMHRHVWKPTTALQVLRSIPRGKQSIQTTSRRTHSHSQLMHGRETLEEPLRQGGEGVVLQIPVCVEGTDDETRRDDKSATENFTTVHGGQHNAWLALQDGQRRISDAQAKLCNVFAAAS